MASTAPVSTTSIATAFIRKLYRLLDIEDSTVIGWDATGRAFSIYDEEEFDARILPRYFRGRVDVFRQHLAEHGFRSTTTAGVTKQITTFVHEHFVRGEPSGLSKITRVPSTKRRRSKLGKKRSLPEVAPSSPVKLEQPITFRPSFVEDEDFDLCKFLQEPSTVQTSSGSGLANGHETLHDSLIRILAQHATNPVPTSMCMLNECDGRLGTHYSIDTPIFTDDMMMSMVEWLDTSA